MPTYDYSCNNCGHEFELFQTNFKKKRICPKCGQKSLDRHIGKGGGLIFRGEGFYDQSDHKRKDYEKTN